jgi:hypothetical protein
MKIKPLKPKSNVNLKIRELSVEESAILLRRIHPDYPNLREDFRVGTDDFVME